MHKLQSDVTVITVVTVTQKLRSVVNTDPECCNLQNNVKPSQLPQKPIVPILTLIPWPTQGMDPI